MEKGMQGVFFISALASIIAVALICIFMFARGVPAIAEIGVFDFLGGTSWKPTDVPPSFGILPMIVGSPVCHGRRHSGGCAHRPAVRHLYGPVLPRVAV